MSATTSRGQVHDTARLILGDEALVAVAEAVDLADAVAARCSSMTRRADHVVEARAKPAAGDDAGAGLGGVEEDFPSRPGRLERRQLRRRLCRLRAETVSSNRTLSDSSTL